MGYDSGGGLYRFNVYDGGDRDRLVDMGPVITPGPAADGAPAYDPEVDDYGSMVVIGYMLIAIFSAGVGYFAGWLTWGG